MTPKAVTIDSQRRRGLEMIMTIDLFHHLTPHPVKLSAVLWPLLNGKHRDKVLDFQICTICIEYIEQLIEFYFALYVFDWREHASTVCNVQLIGSHRRREFQS